MKNRPLLALLNQLREDFYSPEFWWLALVLVLILAFSWAVAYRLRARRPADAPPRGASAGATSRVVFPLLALALVAIAHKTLLLRQWEHLSFLSLATALLASWALARILVYLLRSVFPLGVFLKASERFFTFLIWGGMLLHLAQLDDPLIEILQQVRFGVGKEKLDLWMLLHGTVVIGVTLLVALWAASFVERRLAAAEKMDGNVREVLSRLTKALALVVALLLSLSLVGIDVTALSVFSGALAVGLGFGLQKIASNYVSGFIILLDRSIRLGDLVAIDDKTNGRVAQITTRYTVLRTMTGVDVIIPNEYLVSNMVRNLSYADTQVRVGLSVSVAYGTDLEQAMALMTEAAKQHPRVLADPAPGVALADFGESGINLELGFWIEDPQAGTGNVRSDIALAIWRVFGEKKIEIPFPTREVRIVGEIDAAAPRK
jgi:small-conductance mechanosensitive channel